MCLLREIKFTQVHSLSRSPLLQFTLICYIPSSTSLHRPPSRLHNSHASVHHGHIEEASEVHRCEVRPGHKRQNHTPETGAHPLTGSHMVMAVPLQRSTREEKGTRMVKGPFRSSAHYSSPRPLARTSHALEHAVVADWDDPIAALS